MATQGLQLPPGATLVDPGVMSSNDSLALPPGAKLISGNAPSNSVQAGIERGLQGATINPPESGVIPTIERFRARLEGMFGGGKIERGTGSAAVPVLAGPVLGTARAVQGEQEIEQGHPIKGINNVIGGAGQTLALPMAVANPATIAYAVPSSIAQNATQKILQGAGVDPDKAELAGNVAGITTGTSLARPDVPIKVAKSVGAVAKPFGKLPVIKDVIEVAKAANEVPGDLKDIWTPDSKPTPQATQAAQAVSKTQSTPAPTGPIRAVTSGDPRTRVTLGNPVPSGDYQVSQILQAGKEVGRMVYDVEGDRATIHWIGDSQMKNSLSNQLGPVALKQLFMKFAKQNPDIKTIQGIRVGGANGDEAMSTVYDVSNLYGKSPQKNLVPTHQRQLAGLPGRVGVTHSPSPAEPMTVPAGPVTQPRVPANDEDMTNLLMESLRQAQARRNQ